MILAEGYTDVLALHQAGIRNAVGIMGTSLTNEQVETLAKIAGTGVLCLDADNAGRQAMLKAAQAARGRLELRVVGLPEGSDPADLVATDGAEGVRARIERSVPFVQFEVDRILADGDTASAEGRDRALAELAPVLSGLGPSALRDELMRRVSGALELAPARLASALEQAGTRESTLLGTGAGRPGRPRAGERRSGTRSRTAPVRPPADRWMARRRASRCSWRSASRSPRRASAR